MNSPLNWVLIIWVFTCPVIEIHIDVLCVDVCVSEVSPPRRVSVDAVGLENMTVCWWPSLDEEVDEYYIQLHPQTNQAQTREFWVNGSTCISLTQLKSGGTYEVGVAAVRGRNMSVVTTIQQTLSMFHFCFHLPFPPRCFFQST